MITINENEIVETVFEKEDYFPIKVCRNNNIDNIKYVQYEKDEYNMLEFTLDRTTNEFCRFQLVIGNTFCVKDELLIHADTWEEGVATFDSPEVVKTELFDVLIYLNGVEIILSSAPVRKWLKTGNILFGLDSGGELGSIRIMNISADERQHIIDELSQN